MAVSFVAATVSGANAGSPASVARPGATGDVMLAVMAVASNTATLTAPSGWTLLGTAPNGTYQHILGVFYKVDVGEAGPVTFSWSAAVVGRAYIVAYRGALAPDASHLETDTASATVSNTGVTPGTGGETVVMLSSIAYSATHAVHGTLADVAGLTVLTPSVSTVSVPATGGPIALGVLDRVVVQVVTAGNSLGCTVQLTTEHTV